MNKHGLVFLTGLLFAATVVGCGHKQNDAAPEMGKAGQDESRKVAEKFVGLLISHCPAGYVAAVGKPNIVYREPFNVKVDSIPIGPHSEEQFLGYQWKGEVEIMRAGDGVAYQIFKRGGRWFYRYGGNEGDIPIDELQSIRPECPK